MKRFSRKTSEKRVCGRRQAALETALAAVYSDHSDYGSSSAVWNPARNIICASLPGVPDSVLDHTHAGKFREQTQVFRPAEMQRPDGHTACRPGRNFCRTDIFLGK